MQALFYDVRPAGWLICRCLQHVWQGCLWSRLGGLTLRQCESPALPGPQWVRLRTLLGGICGTDTALLAQRQPPNSILQAFGSMPMILGHENVAVVDLLGEGVESSWLGRRVCVDPTLCCVARGIEPPCESCREGNFGVCESFGARPGAAPAASLPPGTSIGYNSRTGGSWGEQFVAHVSQLVPVPDGIGDELAVLTDPVACSLHGVLRSDWERARRVLVYGAGVMGLGVTASLRALGYAGDLDALDPSPRARELAAKLGAGRTLALPVGPPLRRGRQIASLLGTCLRAVRLGNYVLEGGYDVAYDCVGSPQSMGECLKWTRARGQVVLVATGSRGPTDITPLWFRELSVIGTYGRGMESFAGRRAGTYQLVHELMLSGKLGLPAAGMLTHMFPLGQYKQAIRVAMNKGRHGAIKVAFDFRQERRNG